jgi:hypothetical protein
MTGEGHISVDWMKSLDHCSTRLVMRGQERLKLRIRN